ncbi:pre-B-cell leukemia homeobox interacting protein 1b isoform X2 [Megalobrama amblycephala]|uniref:pre-B-cell leukemia homeobox interacting protein 1b isoform X2 n=1 Tax=Megalobrama amblycephala TaxID=75352 RepID=UPI0020146DBE|nr:pre-B-cell leukemia homeobox interacting protein 1b isoform X2 [Megalobrama amblycephala]
MSENSNSANGNSWTVLTPVVKESGVENVGPVAEGLKVEGQLSKAPEPPSEANSDLKKHSSEASAHQPETETSSQLLSDPALTRGSDQAQETQVTSPESEGRAQLNSARVNEDPSSVSATVEDVSSWTPDHEEREALTGHSESPVSPGTDVDSFSDSYTHISPTSGSSPLPASVCQERDWFKSDEESLRQTITEESKEVLETNRKEWDGLRKRKVSHLSSLDKTEADDDDEEGEEEDFQPPQREEETVFSLNKCILAAVILLGLGTIFFSEADMDVKELKDPTNQEWLNPEVSRDTPVGLQPPDILNKQAKEDQQILVLQAQLQQHQGELKAAQLLAEVGEKERVRREELEKEYQRIKGELDRVPALQKELEQENERMKEENVRAKKELEALPSLQRELEHLRAKVSQLTQSTESADPVHPVAASQIPPAGDKRDVPPIERQDMKHRKTWDKKSEEKEQSKGDKERKKKKSGKKEDDKEMSKRGTEGERTKEQKDWRKDKSHQEEGKAGKRKEGIKDKKRDDGKMGKESEDKKGFKEWQEKKEWKEDKKGKKDKHVGQDERRGDKKDWKDTGKKKGKEGKEWKLSGERKEDKDWKSDKQSGGNDHKEWKEKKTDEWKGEKEWRKSEGKHNDKTEKKWKGEREFGGKEMKEKHWREKERESKDEERKREEIKEEKKNKAFYHKNEGKRSPNEKEKQQKEGHGAPEETTSHHHSDHQNYWSKQRERIQHYNGRRETCSGVADCARVEGLSPVGLRDFETLLQSYLNKLQDPEDQTSREEELHKLVKEFFTDGVFAHDQMPFSEFVEDVGDILEDMAEGEDSDSEEEESDDDDDDDEMEEFEREAMEKFALPKEVRKVERKGEQKKESGRVKG